MSAKAAFGVAITFTIFGCLFFVVSIASTGWISGCMDMGSLTKNMLSGLGGGFNTGPSRQARDLSDTLGDMANSLGNSLGGVFGNSDSDDTSNPFGDLDMSDLGDGFKDTLSSLGDAGNTLSNLGGDLDDALSNIGNAGNTGLSNLGSDLDGALSNLGQSIPGGLPNICVGKGVYKLSMSVMGIESSVPLKVQSIAVGMIIGSIGVVVAILCSAAAAIALITAAASSGESYEGKGRAAKRARVGAVLLVIAGVMGMIGMVACTVESARDVSDPGRIMKQFMAASADMASQMAPGAMPSGNMDDEISKMMGPIGGAVFNFHISYSLILGWVAFVCLLVGMILSLVGKQSLLSQPYTGHDGSVKL